MKRRVILVLSFFIQTAIVFEAGAADTTIKGTGATSATAGLEVTNSSDTSLLYVRNDGNVGIGTTNPGALLDVEKNQDALTQILVGNTSTGTSGRSGIIFTQNGGSQGAGLGYANSSFSLGAGYESIRSNSLYWASNTGATGGLSFISAETNAPITFFTGGYAAANERVRITNAGNVGIGTTAPGATLDVVSANYPVMRGTRTTSDTNLLRGVMVLRHQTTADMVDGFGVQFAFQIRDSAGVDNDLGGLSAVRDGADNSGKLSFQVFNAGVQNLGAMVIDKSGNVGIGTTSPNAAALLDVSSTAKGFLPPRMTTAQRDAIATPPAGLMIYNTTTNKLNFYNGTAWEVVTSS